jgi:hypothetical protein
LRCQSVHDHSSRPELFPENALERLTILTLQAMTNVWCQNIGKNIGLAETMFYPMFWLKNPKNQCSEFPNMVNITNSVGKHTKCFVAKLCLRHFNVHGMFWAKNIGQCLQ